MSIFPNQPNHDTTYKKTVSSTLDHRRLFSSVGAFLLTIAMVVVFFISQLVGVYIASKLILPAADKLSVSELFSLGSSQGTVISVSILISAVLLTVVTFFIVRLKGGDVKQYLKLHSFSLGIGIRMLGWLVVFMVGSELLTAVLDKTPLVFMDPLYQSVSSVWLLTFALVIVAPFYEELVFRGLLWSAISEQFLTSVNSEKTAAVIASIVTSIIFATIHVQYGWYEISSIVVLALIFCYARIKSGSLLLCILLHSINNGVAMMLYLTQVT